MYTLHIANKNYSSWSLRPWVLLKALHIPFIEKLHPFPSTNCRDAFRRFSPTGKVPCLTSGELVVWDSLAIVEFLAEHHKEVWPADTTARAWARSAAAEMHSGFSSLRQACSMNCGLRIQLKEITWPLQDDLDRLSELWAEGLERFGGPYLAGDKFTAVDAFFAPVAFRIQTYQLILTPLAQSYTQHLLEEPAMQEWYREALSESWREPEHEADSLNAGSLITDLRQI